MKTKEIKNIVEHLNVFVPELSQVEQDKLTIAKWCIQAFNEDKKMSHIEFVHTSDEFKMKPHYSNKKDNTLITIRHKRYYKGLDLLESKCGALKEVAKEINHTLIQNTLPTDSWVLNKTLSNLSILINDELAQKLSSIVKEKNTLSSKIKANRDNQTKELVNIEESKPKLSQ